MHLAHYIILSFDLYFMNHSSFLNFNDISSTSCFSCQWTVQHWIFLSASSSPQSFHLLPSSSHSSGFWTPPPPPYHILISPCVYVCVCMCVCPVWVEGWTRGAGAADSCCIHACSVKWSSPAAGPFSCLWCAVAPMNITFLERCRQKRVTMNLVRGVGVLNWEIWFLSLDYTLLLTPHVSLLLLFSYLSSQWQIGCVRDVISFVISTDELCRNVIKEDAD